MSDILTDALKGAAIAVARRSDNSLDVADATKVASAMAQEMPAPAALESLWPQLVRYGITMLGTALAAHGVGDEATWQAVAGGVIAIAPPIWRIGTTWWERRKVA
ncbi:hypothetical protein ABLE91_05880 [Aquabacter sp. CN5-332]|uniref:Pam3-gp28 family putative phage holin n=1 Tax=Aquabacter sp. CN5-332 TaxID=3156608 RepID=UPI0032B37522